MNLSIYSAWDLHPTDLILKHRIAFAVDSYLQVHIFFISSMLFHSLINYHPINLKVSVANFVANKQNVVSLTPRGFLTTNRQLITHNHWNINWSSQFCVGARQIWKFHYYFLHNFFWKLFKNAAEFGKMFCTTTRKNPTEQSSSHVSDSERNFPKQKWISHATHWSKENWCRINARPFGF